MLENISKFSLTLEQGSILVLEVPLLLETTTSANEDLLTNHDISDFLQESSIFLHKDMDDKLLEVVWKLPKTGHNRKLATNREYVDVVVSRSQWTYIDGARTHVTSVKNHTVQEVNSCLTGRFQTFQQDSLFSNMIWVNPANWTDKQQN